MDYTSLQRIIDDLDNKVNGANSLRELAQDLTDSSRAMDRLMTGVGDPTSTDYLKLEAKTETLFGRYTRQGSIVVYPRKPVVTAVTSMQYRLNPLNPWYTLNLTGLVIDGIRVECYDANMGASAVWGYPGPRGYFGMNGINPREVQVLISYTGGFATSGSDLMEDIQEVASLLTIRHYREVKAGLGDAIGVAELGQLIYTKADPLKVVKRLEPYHRVCGWRGTM